MNISGSGLMMMWCNNMATSPPLPPYGVPERNFTVDTVEDRILDFLDGRTHGEDLFHALYDDVLDEPIPERMRLLFAK